jgi:transposase
MNEKATKFSPEVRERAVRLVREQFSEHPAMRAAVESIAPMIGCTPQTLLDSVKREEVDRGEREGVSTAEGERIKALEREVKELRRTNE